MKCIKNFKATVLEIETSYEGMKNLGIMTANKLF